MADPDSYGKLYCFIKTSLSNDGEIHVHADRVEVTVSGDLVCYGQDGVINLAISVGLWQCVYAASALDGSAVAVEHWDGEVDRA